MEKCFNLALPDACAPLKVPRRRDRVACQFSFGKENGKVEFVTRPSGGEIFIGAMQDYRAEEAASLLANFFGAGCLQGAIKRLIG